MKTLLATASASILLLAAGACSDADAPNERAGYDNNGQVQTEAVINGDTVTVDTANSGYDADLDVNASTRTEYTLAQGEMEASDLIGAPVRNGTGEDIATVSDIFFGRDGSDPQILVRDGGIGGLGGDQRVVEFDTARITNLEGDEPEVFIQITQASLEMLPEYEQEELNDYRLASELIGTMSSVSFSDDKARLNDLIITQTGELRYALISPGMLPTENIVMDADTITVAQGDGDGEVVINTDQAAFDAAPIYRSE